MNKTEHIEQNDVIKSFLIEIKLSINHKLFVNGYITEEMYTKAKEIIIKS